MEVDAHIHHLENLMSDVPEMGPYVKQRIRSLTNQDLDGATVTPSAVSPSTTTSPHRMRGEQIQIGEWMENRVLVTSILNKNTIGFSGGKKSLKTKSRSVFGMSLEEIYSVTSIPIPIILAQCIYYLKTFGGLKTEVRDASKDGISRIYYISRESSASLDRMTKSIESPHSIAIHSLLSI